MRGNLIELGPKETPHELKEALASYRRAAEIDPTFAEAWDEIGHYYDVILAEPLAAQEYFQRAKTIRKTA